MHLSYRLKRIVDKVIPDEENLMAIEWKKRYNSLSEEKKKKMDEMDKHSYSDYQLKTIKRKRSEVKEGDVFVLSPREGVYFYGKVLEAKIKSPLRHHYSSDLYVVFIFKCKTKNISIDDFKADYNELLISPAIVDKKYWTLGLFYTVGNIPLTKEEKKLDYGFYDMVFGNFIKSNGSKIFFRKPKFYGTASVTCREFIGIKVEEELIINPDLLKF